VISKLESGIGSACVESATILAGDYLNRTSGETIERECKRFLDLGHRELVVDFSKTEIVNSIGVSILLGVIDSARMAGARVIFTDVNEITAELFDTLGVTRHVALHK
jgi:anti-anti-sigma regulatory factor